MEECGTTNTISKEIIEKSEEGVKEQAQKRFEAWVDNNNQPAIAPLESSNRSISPELPEPPLILPPLEDPSVILTSPEFLPKTKIHSDKSKIYIPMYCSTASGKFGIAKCSKICKKSNLGEATLFASKANQQHILKKILNGEVAKRLEKCRIFFKNVDFSL